MAVSKAAASEGPRRTLVRYVEGLSDARTKLADFFTILLLDLGKIEGKRHLATVGRIDRDRRLSHGIEIAIGK